MSLKYVKKNFKLKNALKFCDVKIIDANNL